MRHTELGIALVKLERFEEAKNKRAPSNLFELSTRISQIWDGVRRLFARIVPALNPSQTKGEKALGKVEASALTTAANIEKEFKKIQCNLTAQKKRSGKEVQEMVSRLETFDRKSFELYRLKKVINKRADNRKPLKTAHARIEKVREKFQEALESYVKHRRQAITGKTVMPTLEYGMEVLAVEEVFRKTLDSPMRIAVQGSRETSLTDLLTKDMPKRLRSRREKIETKLTKATEEGNKTQALAMLQAFQEFKRFVYEFSPVAQGFVEGSSEVDVARRLQQKLPQSKWAKKYALNQKNNNPRIHPVLKELQFEKNRIEEQKLQVIVNHNVILANLALKSLYKKKEKFILIQEKACENLREQVLQEQLDAQRAVANNPSDQELLTKALTDIRNIAPEEKEITNRLKRESVDSLLEQIACGTFGMKGANGATISVDELQAGAALYSSRVHQGIERVNKNQGLAFANQILVAADILIRLRDQIAHSQQRQKALFEATQRSKRAETVIKVSQSLPENQQNLKPTSQLEETILKMGAVIRETTDRIAKKEQIQQTQHIILAKLEEESKSVHVAHTAEGK